jgi:hypothetical protein
MSKIPTRHKLEEIIFTAVRSVGNKRPYNTIPIASQIMKSEGYIGSMI